MYPLARKKSDSADYDASPRQVGRRTASLSRLIETAKVAAPAARILGERKSISTAWPVMYSGVLTEYMPLYPKHVGIWAQGNNLLKRFFDMEILKERSRPGERAVKRRSMASEHPSIMTYEAAARHWRSSY